jgi:flagella basal body P-ring formation protein FlgA
MALWFLITPIFVLSQAYGESENHVVSTADLLEDLFLAYLHDNKYLEENYEPPDIDPRMVLPKCGGEGLKIAPRKSRDRAQIVVLCRDGGWKRYFNLSRNVSVSNQTPSVPHRTISSSSEKKNAMFTKNQPYSRKSSVIRGLVMNTSVQRGEVIQDMMIDVVELQNEQRVRDIVTHRGQVSGRVARISLPKGTVLNSRHIRRDPVLVKGQRLEIISVGKGFSVSADGIALQSADVGEVIKVLNLKSQKTLQARVVSKYRVEIANFSLQN